MHLKHNFIGQTGYASTWKNYNLLYKRFFSLVSFFLRYSFIGQAQRATSAKHTANSHAPDKTFCDKILYLFRMKNLYCCCHSFGVIPKRLLPRLGHTLDKPLSLFTIMSLFELPSKGYHPLSAYYFSITFWQPAGTCRALWGVPKASVIGEVLSKPRAGPPGDALLSHCTGGATPLLTLQSTGCPLNLRHVLYYI